MTFRADAEQTGGTALLRMAGDLDARADTALLAAHGRAVASDPQVLTLDFTAVDYINSSGIALLITLLTEARDARRTVYAMGLSDHYRHIFEITHLSDYITFSDDNATATAGAPGHDGADGH